MDHPEITKDNWKKYVQETVAKMNVQKAQQDIYRFLENLDDKKLITKDNFFRCL